MTKVFIAGSRTMARFEDDVKRRIDSIIAKGFTILVGDANGADAAVQRYLAEKSFSNVIVYCMAGHCRNNVGRWPAREIVAAPGARGFDYYATKDLAMVNDADCGLMLWDCKSKGTLNDVIQLVRQGKLVVVYLGPEHRFMNLRSQRDLNRMISTLDPATMQQLGRQLGVERQIA